MHSQKSVPYCLLVACLLLVCGASARVCAGPKGVRHASADYSKKLVHEAHVHLVLADPVYKSHRARAIRLIHGTGHNAQDKVTRRKKVGSMGLDSDGRMRAAQSLLKQARSGLSDRAQNNVDKAIEEISIGLQKRD